MPAEWIGRRIGDFVVERELGRGGMGVVYEARDERLRRHVALKALLGEGLGDPELRQRFEREARAAARLSHPFVAQVFAVIEEEGRPFIVMERLEGETLAARLARGRIPASEALAIGADVADALAEAHRQGVVHRDLKPSNVFLTRTGHVKVMDFGLARVIDPSFLGPDADTRTAATRATGTLLGTPGYLAPEQARGLAAGPAADVFALGIVLVEMLTGSNPFAASHLAESLYRLFRAEPLAEAAFGPEVPRPVIEVVRAALSREPSERPAPARLERVLRAAIWEMESPAAESGESHETRYADSGGVRIAYQVVGEGAIDLVYMAGWVSNVELAWENPGFIALARGLRRHARLLLFDKRGTGLSDRVREDQLPTLEQRMDDLRAVMDAAGSTRAVLLGVSESGPMCMLFAATYPERVHALIGFGTYARRVPTADYPWAPDPAARQKWLDAIEANWGQPVDLSQMAPSLAGNEAFSRWWARYLRQSSSPRAAVALGRMNTQVDVCQILPLIRVPALIVHRTGDRDSQVEGGRYIASRIPGARFIELPGDDHIPWVNPGQVLEAIGPFLEEARSRAHAELESLVSTVLHARGLKALSSEQSSAMEALIAGFRGRRLPSEPERLVASFDGPARALRCAQALRAELLAGAALGLHTGECRASGPRAEGVAPRIAASLAAEARPGEVLASRTVCDLVAGSGIVFDPSPVAIRDPSGEEWTCFEVRG